MQDVYQKLDGAENVCCSGGAEGADLQFGMCAGTRGDVVLHYGFRGHRSQAPKEEIITLTAAQLEEANPHLEVANKTLRRKFPTSSEFVNNLLRRNYYQVVYSESLYAVSEIGKDNLVKGGTSWAVQMMLDLHPEGKVYVYDQKKEQWFQWKNGWCPIIDPPAPSGIWAGVGTRELNEAGKAAIRKLLGWVKPEAALTAADMPY